MESRYRIKATLANTRKLLSDINRYVEMNNPTIPVVVESDDLTYDWITKLFKDIKFERSEVID